MERLVNDKWPVHDNKPKTKKQTENLMFSGPLTSTENYILKYEIRLLKTVYSLQPNSHLKSWFQSFAVMTIQHQQALCGLMLLKTTTYHVYYV